MGQVRSTCMLSVFQKWPSKISWAAAPRHWAAIMFVKGGRANDENNHDQLCLFLAWLQLTLGRQLNISTHIIQSSLRPDLILISEATRQLTLLELTVTWEKRKDEAQERKRAKYQELMVDCSKNGWRLRCMPVEVVSRGFAGHSLSKAYEALGIKGPSMSRAM